MKLTFREFSGINWWDRWKITHNFTKMRDRFISLNIPVPAETPPIDLKPGSTFEMNPALNLQIYRGNISPSRADFEKAGVRTFTYGYSLYVISAALKMKSGYVNDKSMQQSNVLSTFSEYFDRSYWNSPVGPGFGFWTEPIWRIRTQLTDKDGIRGKDFTDEMAAAALMSIADNPGEGDDPDINVYICSHLKIGDTVHDSGNSRWPEILDILKKDNPLYARACPQ